MMKIARLMAITCLLSGAICVIGAYNGKLLKAKAVSVQWRHGWQNWAGMCCECYNSFPMGSIVVYTIVDSRVTHADTIYRRELGLAEYPAFNLSGTKIAFYRSSTAPAATGTGCTTVNGGISYVSIINADGTGLANLVQLPSTPEGSGNGNEIIPLDWPAGNWIYYERTHDPADIIGGASSSVDIWRVNAATSAAQKVTNFTTSGGGEIKCTYFRRFSLNLKASYMAAQTMTKYGCSADVGAWSGGNSILSFPAGQCVGYRNACNISISPSGQVVASYFAGWHDDLQIGTPDYSKGFTCYSIGNDVSSVGLKQVSVQIQRDLVPWTGGEFVGQGAELIRWAVNSDKWVMQEIGMYKDGHAGYNADGSNQILCNFVDSVAINISKNTVPPHNSPNDAQTAPDGTMFWNNCAGDLWVDDAINNPNGNRYEDLKGIWHPGDSTAVIEAARVLSMAIEFRLEAGRLLCVRLPRQAASEVSLADIRGVSIMRMTACGALRVSLADRAAGAYFVTVRNGGARVTARIVLR